MKYVKNNNLPIRNDNFQTISRENKSINILSHRGPRTPSSSPLSSTESGQNVLFSQFYHLLNEEKNQNDRNHQVIQKCKIGQKIGNEKKKKNIDDRSKALVKHGKLVRNSKLKFLINTPPSSIGRCEDRDEKSKNCFEHVYEDDDKDDDIETDVDDREEGTSFIGPDNRPSLVSYLNRG